MSKMQKSEKPGFLDHKNWLYYFGDLNHYLKLLWNSEKREGLKKETHWELKIIMKNEKQ